MIAIPPAFLQKLLAEREAGMGYQVVTVVASSSRLWSILAS
jgi:hypothetical protein